MVKVINALEYNYHYRMTCKCEPQLGKRGLYPTVSRKGVYDEVKTLTNMLAYFDGKNDLIEISNIINAPVDALIPLVEKTSAEGLINKVE
jgi:aminopeptidase-like protein